MTAVLNERLYKSLKARFGDVVIHNSGDSAHILARKVIKKVGLMSKYSAPERFNNQVTGGEYYAVNCPYCADGRNRLWVSYLYGEEINGTVSRHTLICYNENCDTRDFQDELKPYLSRHKRKPIAQLKTVSEMEPPKEIVFPEGCESLLDLPDSHPAIKYITGRHFTAEEVDVFGVVYCKSNFSVYGRYLDNRLVFPFYLDSKLIGYQTRVIDPRDKTSKYWLLPGSKKTYTFFGLGVFADVKDVFIVEGVFDAIRVGEGGFAIFGKTISTFQIDLLKKYYPSSNVYVMLDQDATADSYKLKDKLEASGCINRVTVVPLLTKDPADTALWELQNRIDEFRV